MTERADRPEEITLLDLFVVLAESWKLLVFVPLLAGAVTFLILWLQPVSFRTQATVALSLGEANDVAFPPVVDPVVKEFALAARYGGDAVAARRALAAGISISNTSNPDTTVVALARPTPDDAEPLLSALLKRLEEFREWGTRWEKRRWLVTELEIRSDELARVLRARAALEGSFAPGAEGGDKREENARAFSQLTGQIEAGRLAIADLNQKIAELPSRMVISPPSSPVVVGRSTKYLVALVMMAVAFVVLAFVFVRESVRRAARDPIAAEKVGRIRRAFSLPGAVSRK